MDYDMGRVTLTTRVRERELSLVILPPGIRVTVPLTIAVLHKVTHAYVNGTDRISQQIKRREVWG